MNKAKTDVLWDILDDSKPQAAPTPTSPDPVATLFDSVPGLMPGASTSMPGDAPATDAQAPDIAPILARFKAAHDAWALLEMQVQILKGKLAEVVAVAEKIDTDRLSGGALLEKLKAIRPRNAATDERIAKGEVYCADLNTRALETGTELNRLRTDLTKLDAEEEPWLAQMEISSDEALRLASIAGPASICPTCVKIIEGKDAAKHAVFCWGMASQASPGSRYPDASEDGGIRMTTESTINRH